MKRRGWRIAESLFLIAGLVLVDWYIWTQARAILYQAYANRMFSRELLQLRQATPPAAPRLSRNDLVGRLQIPRLDIDVMVREGADEATLSEAVGHLPSSPLPGAPGNVALAGHRDTFFRPLRNIKVNDTLMFATVHGTFEYRVESVTIVLPDDVSVLHATAEPTLTLVTCYPFYYVGSAPKRFIVRARQVEPGTPDVPAARVEPVKAESPKLSASAVRRRHRVPSVPD
jgi:sortase A